MLIRLTSEQLDDIAPIDGDGVITVDTDALASIVAENLGIGEVFVAVSSVDYDQHNDGTFEPNTRAIKGICWHSLGDNRCNRWAFNSDGHALTVTDEGEHEPCPVSEDANLIAKAIIAIADSYPDAIIDERNNRLTVRLSNGTEKKVRVVVTTDPRIVRAEDVLYDLELIAYRAGTLGVAMVTPVQNGQAVVRKCGLD